MEKIRVLRVTFSRLARFTGNENNTNTPVVAPFPRLQKRGGRLFSVWTGEHHQCKVHGQVGGREKRIF